MSEKETGLSPVYPEHVERLRSSAKLVADGQMSLRLFQAEIQGAIYTFVSIEDRELRSFLIHLESELETNRFIKSNEEQIESGVLMSNELLRRLDGHC